jgi:hypothetical protein
MPKVVTRMATAIRLTAKAVATGEPAIPISLTVWWTWL